MDTELVFRILFLLLLLAGSAIRGHYARKLPERKGSIRERLKDVARVEGWSWAVLLTVQGLYLIVATALYLLASPWIFWSQLPIPDWLRWLGVGSGIISLPFLLWIHHTLGRHWTVSLELQEEHRLVTSGPYRWVRHPMYTVHIVYFFAWVLVSANLLLLINYLLTLTLVFARIPKEEKMLLEQFGGEYGDYMKRTGRLLPHPRRKADRGAPA